MDWWSSLSHEQQINFVIPFASTLLGGAITLASSLIIFRVSKKSEKTRAEAELMGRRKMYASIGLAKLIAITNILYSVKKTIDGQFEEIGKHVVGSYEPALAIQPLIGVDRDFERVAGEDIEFLMAVDSGGLISEIEILQRRLGSTLAAVENYSELGKELKRVLHSGAKEMDDQQGPGVSVLFEVIGSEGVVAEAIIGSMNRALADLIEALEKDLKEALRVAEKYRKVAVGVFGEKFPKITNSDEVDNALL